VPRLTHCLLLVFLALTTASPVLAQRDRDTWNPASPSSFEVSGQVRHSETGLPAQRVPIKLERFGGGLVDQIDTDSNGRFRFPNLPRGYYRVVINMPGFVALQQDADLQVVFRAHLAFELVRQNTGEATIVDVIDARAPAPARQELTRGREALSQRNADEAMLHFRRAIELYPEFFDAHLLKGIAHMDKREWLEAQRAFEKAVEIRPDSAPALVRLGEVQWRQKQFDEAEKNLLAGLKIDDKIAHAHFTLARLYLEKDDVMKAGVETGKTLQLKPEFAEAHLLAGNILLRLNQQERALIEYQEYLKLEPKGEFAVQARDLIQKLAKSISENKK
jgi:tetratricopeptide (TPR) repeat protein